jgi:hypothetical protein
LVMESLVDSLRHLNLQGLCLLPNSLIHVFLDLLLHLFQLSLGLILRCEGCMLGFEILSSNFLLQGSYLIFKKHDLSHVHSGISSRHNRVEI